MARENKAARQERLGRLLQGLRLAYPDAHCELNFRTPLELLVATILSAQCTDKQVNIVTAKLFEKYRQPADYANVPLAELEQDVRAIGLYRNKAKNIQACCRKLIERHGGEVPSTMEELTALDGVGRKTANVVLGNAFQMNHGIVVDTHVTRLVDRLRLTAETSPEKIEMALQEIVPNEHWTLVSHWLIWHGRRRCMARNPDCPNCEVAALCPSRGLGTAPLKVPPAVSRKVITP